MNSTYLIVAYEPKHDRTSFFEDLKVNANNEADAFFNEHCQLAKQFDSLVEAQSIAKVLVSKYVKHIKVFNWMQLLNNADVCNIEVYLQQDKSKMCPIWNCEI